MAEEKKKEEKTEEGEEGAAPPSPAGPSKLPMLMGLVNTVVILAVIGLTAYTKLVFKRPAITESSERNRLAQAEGKSLLKYNPGMIVFDPVLMDVDLNHPFDPQGTEEENKQHYASVGFALELKDMGKKDAFEKVRPYFIDKMLFLFAKKTFEDLTTVQGRYLLRNEIIEMANGLVTRQDPTIHDRLVIQVYFTQLIVQ